MNEDQFYGTLTAPVNTPSPLVDRLTADLIRGQFGKSTRTQILMSTQLVARLNNAVTMVNAQVPETAQTDLEGLVSNIIEKALADLGV